MEYDFKNSYMSINDKIEINIDMTRFKGNLAKAQQNLVYQIISDTQDNGMNEAKKIIYKIGLKQLKRVSNDSRAC